MSYSHSKGSTDRHFAAQKELKSITSLKQFDDCDNFPWAVGSSNISSMYYCKYCERNISKRFSKNQHQRTKQHMLREKNFKGLIKNTRSYEHIKCNNNNTDAADASNMNKKNVTYPQLPLSTAAFPWIGDFDWLVCKTNDSTAKWFCETCKQTLIIRTYNHAFKHQNTKKHTLQMTRIINNSAGLTQEYARLSRKQKHRRSKSNTDKIDELSEYTEISDSTSKQVEEHLKNYNNKTTTNLMDKFPWVEKSSKDDYAYCSMCRIRIPISNALMKRNHTSGHANKELNLLESSTINAIDIGSNCSTSNDEDVVVVDSLQEIRRQNISDVSLVLLKNGEGRNMKPPNIQKRGLSEKLVDSQLKRLKGIDSTENDLILSGNSNTSFVANLINAPLTLGDYIGPLFPNQLHGRNNTQHSLSTFSKVYQNPYNSISENNDSSKHNSYDLFFRSISETIKKLPLDIATEGKLKITKIICDLAVKALKRQLQQTEEDISSCEHFGNKNVCLATINYKCVSK